MTRQLVLKQVIAVFYLLFWVSPVTAAENFSQRLFTAHQQNQPMPHLSHQLPNSSLAEAYTIQLNYVKLRQKTDSIAGYKAGLTSAAGQERFSVSQALSGVLFSSGHVVKSVPIRLGKTGKLMLETEIGFTLNKPVTSPITQLEQLKSTIESVVAVIELPSLAYEEPTQIAGMDLVASNVASNQFLLGNKFSVGSIPALNQLSTQLRHEGNALFSGKATDALGDQWLALQWLINNLLQQGYELSAGELLITGALGKMVPAQLGNYVADFGPLGQIKFTVIP